MRDGQVVNRPIYLVIGVTVNRERDILGLWAGDGSEGAKFWLGVLTEIKNRGVEDVCIVVCDGLKGLPESINTTWSYVQVQASSIHTARWRDGLAGHRTIGRGPMQTCAFEPACRPVPPGGGGPRSGQRELRFERLDEVPARPAGR